ncbi:aldo/keto reductase [Myxococcota bacterium]|nr:aldo/keto reductase [Myxococcota bacterium]
MHRKASFLVPLLLISAAVMGYFLAGPVLYVIPIGLTDRVGQISKLLGALAIVPLVAFFAVRFWLPRRHDAVDSERRSFLKGSGAGVGVAVGTWGVGAVAATARGLMGLGSGRSWREIAIIQDSSVITTHPDWSSDWREARIRDHRRFGRTGWEISDIVLGTGRITGELGERIARRAIERGVNYFDTSPDYAGSGSEQAMGRAIRGVRDRLFVATKFCTPSGHLPMGTPVPEYKRVIEDSLRRLDTDYVDLVHIHSCDQVSRLMDPNVHEAFDRLKEEGKVRFLGFSSHTPNLEQVANAAIDSGRFDVMMLAYHHGVWKNQPEIISRARREQDMGVVAMKTLKGAKHRGLMMNRPESDSYSQAALKWVLSNRDVSAAVISFFEMQHVDEYLYASGKTLEPDDLALLEKYDALTAGTHCAPHCGDCLGSCSGQLAVNDVLRHRMYFEDYGWEREAMSHYAALEKNASICASCSAPCTGACPIGVDIPERMRGAHDLLTLA